MTRSSAAARAAVAELELVAVASGHLAETVAVHLPFETLGGFKDALKRFFSHGPWTRADEDALSDLVAPHLGSGWWAFDLGHGLVLEHGIDGGRYRLHVVGDPETRRDLFDRVFSGPVRPEQTPHPRKVKFHVGGEPAPGTWHRRGERIDDARVAALFEDDDVSDVMVAGDFVTVGLRPSASWEHRLDDVLARVTDLFWTGQTATGPIRTREQLLEEAGRGHPKPIRAEDLHLLDPDDEDHREVLVAALGSDDPRRRRGAVVTLALSGEPAVARAAIVTGFADVTRTVRRAAVDAAADLEDDEYRPLFEQAVFDPDAWTRWRAVKAIRSLGPGPSTDTLALALADEDFRVRFEAEAALRAAP